MGKDVFQSDDLCMISHQMKQTIKDLNRKYETLKETAESSEDIKDKELISSMRSELIENKALLDKHISITYLRKLVKIDEQHEQKCLSNITDLLEKVSFMQASLSVKINSNELKTLQLYSSGMTFEEIESHLGWSEAVAFKQYITGMYKLKRFFKKDFDDIYQDLLDGKSRYEARTIEQLKKFRDDSISKNLFKPRTTTLPKVVNGKREIVKIKEEEILTLIKINEGESYKDISTEMGWRSKATVFRYYESIIEKICKVDSAKETSFEELLTEREKKVYALMDEFSTDEISRILNIQLRMVQRIKKKIFDLKRLN